MKNRTLSRRAQQSPLQVTISIREQLNRLLEQRSSLSFDAAHAAEGLPDSAVSELVVRALENGDWENAMYDVDALIQDLEDAESGLMEDGEEDWA